MATERTEESSNAGSNKESATNQSSKAGSVGKKERIDSRVDRPKGKAKRKKPINTSRSSGESPTIVDSDNCKAPTLTVPEGTYIYNDEDKTQEVSRREMERLMQPDGEEDLDCKEIGYLVCAVFFPNLGVILFFSAVGYGLKVYNALAWRGLAVMGYLSIFLAALLVALLYVFDWSDFGMKQRVVTATATFYMAFIGVVLMGARYPWAPVLAVLTHILIFAGALRGGACGHVRRKCFYAVVGVVLFSCACAALLVWLFWLSRGDNFLDEETKEQLVNETSAIYEHIYAPRELIWQIDCHPDEGVGLQVSALWDKDTKAEIALACANAASVWFIAWVSPLICFGCGLVVTAFVFILGVFVDVQETSKVERVLKIFVLGVASFLMGMYVAAEMSGLSVRLGAILMALFMIGLLGLMGWAFLEIGFCKISERVQNSKITERLLQLWQSDWVRAMFVGGLSILLPAFLVLNMLKQKTRRMRNRGDVNDTSELFTPDCERMVNELSTWSWASMLTKICILGELFWCLQVGVAKATYVFLSWMNGVLSSASFVAVVILVFLVGFTMFLLPPVPGVPVYVFAGIVVAEKGRQTGSIGFAGGCIIAIMLCFALKLTACTGQWLIGFYMGKSVKIQQLIGVDKVVTRAIEQILRAPGLTVAKVSVLVGGPDWPTSVTCGILRLNIPQMLLGTSPVIFVLTPCVLAGAFLARVTPGEDSSENVLANAFLGLSVVGQAGSAVIAVYSFTQVIERDGEELAKPRPEHEAVAALTQAEAAYNKTFQEVTTWNRLSSCMRAVVIAAACLIMLSCTVFCLLDELCFRSFAVSSKIGDPYEKDGLKNNAFNIVILPLGLINNIVFVSGVFLHVMFSNRVASLAKRTLRQQEEAVTQEVNTLHADVIGSRE